MLRILAFAFATLLVVSTVDAAPAVRTAPGTVTGEFSYAAGQYWIKAGSETVCVMVDESDEAALAPLNGKKIVFTGPIQTWPDRSRCVVVGPDFPRLAQAPTSVRPRPVTIGAHGQPDIDACPSIGAALAPVAVRLAPADAAGVVLKLAAGQDFYMCGATADGLWESVVVPPSSGADCGVSRAVKTPRPYAGPCKSGWVPARQVEVVAG
jgi:hypothetical protein